jgi:hypothetical protein
MLRAPTLSHHPYLFVIGYYRPLYWTTKDEEEKLGVPILDSVPPSTINTLHLILTMARQRPTLCSMAGETPSSWLMGHLLQLFNPNTDKSNLSYISGMCVLSS